MRALGVIPARGGSKGVPGKNLREVGGEPLIVHAVRTADESAHLEHVVVSTDDAEIARVAASVGARVLMRPPELATDDAPVAPVLMHALTEAESDGHGPFDVVVLLQPTSPLRSGAHVDAALEILRDNADADSVVSVCACEDIHPSRMYTLPSDGTMAAIWPEWERSPRQALPPVYYRNGAIYAIRREPLMGEGLAIGRSPAPLVMPAQLLANVDDERDLIVADALVRAWRSGRLPT